MRRVTSHNAIVRMSIKGVRRGEPHARRYFVASVPALYLLATPGGLQVSGLFSSLSETFTSARSEIPNVGSGTGLPDADD